VFRDPTGQEFVLVIQCAQCAPESPAQAYEEVADEMRQRALVEATERQRRQWLQELHRNVHIDIRL
jgi:hypothetical protein